MANFSKEFERLNPAQKEAVKNIEGPVMVLAGPGTGKTQIVALRIANILQKTQMKPGNILALTFTEAGVTALRNRLVGLIGPDGYLVTISTFHGFANEVINTFPHVFPQVKGGSNLNELERLAIIEDIIESEHVGSPLRPFRRTDTYIKDISRAIKEAKQENITCDVILDSTQKSPSDKISASARESIERRSFILREFAAVFNSYNNYLTEHQLYDYEDMILFVLAALRDSPEVKAHFQERYQYILVDEYQDSNTAQNQLVETLADFFETPNLFVVGDDKQAIYRFQGASVSNMLHFHKRYPMMKLIDLKNNYRSTPEVLKAAAELITNNQTQLKNYLDQTTSQLEAVLGPGDKPEIICSPTAIAEEELIVSKLQNEHQTSPYDQMAVLFRRNADVKRFRRVLEKAGIPTQGEKQLELSSEPMIQNLLLSLKAIDNPNNDLAVLALGRLLVPKTKIIELLSVNRQFSRSRSSLVEIMKESKQKAVHDAAGMILEWHLLSQKVPVFELLEEVLSKTGILSEATSDKRGLNDLDLLRGLLDLAYDFSIKNQEAKLSDWLRHLELSKKYNQSLTITRSMATGGVMVSTIHGVKGLEFELVVMASADSRRWTTKAKRDLIELPAELIGLKDWIDDTTEDERRLFYVGLTRAKKKLVISYSNTDQEGRESLACQFVSEIENSCHKIDYSPTPEALKKFLTASISPVKKESIRGEELDYIREQVKNQGFSYTDLRAYNHCPRQYLLSRVLKIPTLPSSSLVYGNAIHKALEMFFREYKGLRTMPSKAKLIEYYHDSLTKSLPFRERDQYIAKGDTILSAFFDKKKAEWLSPIGVEYTFSPHKVMLDDIWLTGKYDRIDPIIKQSLFDENLVRVVDYKTGSKAKSRNVIEGKTKTSDGEIKKQLVYYALLAARDRLFPYKIKEFEIAFVDDELSFKSEIFEITSGEIKDLEKEIISVYQEILTRKDWSHTADGYDNGCELCELFQDF